MLLYYVNIERQKICGRNNNIIAPICIDFSVITPIKFQFINSQNQIVRLDDTNGLYLAGSLKMGEQPYNLLFLSKDYTVDESGAVTFMLDTCTVPYCEKIKKKNTEINIEIGQVALNDKRVICRDYALANPRVYSPSLAPAQIESADYWTKEETQEAIDLAVSGIQISGYVTTEEFEEGLATKQNVITENEKLDYALISGAPTIPTKTSDLDNDSDYVDSQYVTDATSAFITEDALQGLATEQYVDAAVSGKADKTDLADYQEKITSDAKLAYDLLSGTPTIPSKTSDLQNDSNFVTSAYVQAEVSGKADKAEIPLSTSQLANDSGFITDADLNGYATEDYVQAEVSGKQDIITTDNWLSAECVRTELDPWSGDPEYTVDAAINIVHREALDAKEGLSGKADIADIPLSTSQLANDSGYATSAYVDEVAATKQDVITFDEWLSAGCVRTELDPWSGDPEYTVDAAINIVHQEALAAQAGLSGKADIADIPLSTSQLTNDSGFITDSALTGKQDTIDFDHPISASNVDFDFENWEGGDPNFRLDAALNMVYGFTKDNAAAITGKLDNPSGGTVGQVVKKTADGVEWADDVVINPTFNTLEKKEAATVGEYTVDFTGKQIQKYKHDTATSGEITINFANLDDVPTDSAATIELQIPVNGDVTDRILPDGIDFTEELPEAFEGSPEKFTYHDLVFRAERDEAGNNRVYMNYAYKFDEGDTDFFYLEAAEPFDEVVLSAVNQYPNISKLPELNMKYSTDKVHWNTYLSGTTVILENVGDRVYFKGNNRTLGISSGNDNYYFVASAGTNIGGNIMSLLDERMLKTTVPNFGFYGLFYGVSNSSNTSFRDASNLKLPATYVGDRAYGSMFRGSTQLVKGPKVLPSATMPIYGYYAMFRNCSSLTDSPIMDVPSAQKQCFQNMFRGCSSLSSITVNFIDWNTAEIATNAWVQDVAANGVFKCPYDLQINTGDNYIPANWTVEKTGLFYVEALEDNTSVTLSAIGSPGSISLLSSADSGVTLNTYTIGDTITLANAGDKVSFRTSTNSTYFNTNMSNRYAFVVDKHYKVGGNIMSLIHKSLHDALSIESQQCFISMFMNDINIVDASELKLPATTLSPYCYDQMFQNCTALTSVPNGLPSDAVPRGEHCNSMFRSCSSLIDASNFNMPSTVSSYFCGSMFADCTALTAAPKLPATTLAPNCYGSMFNGCTSLSSINVSFTNWDKSFAPLPTNNWVNNVAPTGVFICPPELDTSTISSAFVPSGWTVIRKY